ncbi:sigma-70 family RNA polymerase sigma factor [Planctomycetota bacterium]
MADGHTTTRLAAEALDEPSDRAERHQVLFQRIMGRIYRYFRRMVFDGETAEDLAQQTLLELSRSLRERTYDPSRSFNAWMWLKARTVFAQWCRSRQRRPARLEDAASLEAPDSPVEASERLSDKDRVLSEVQRQLGTEAYECFTLYYQGGLTHAEIGELLGRHRTTVASRIEAAHRVIDRLLGK